MRDISTKSNGDSYPPDVYNSMRNELQNAVESADITLDPEGGADTDLNMLAKTMALYSGAADFYSDGGSANSYILSRSTNLKAIPAYKDGLLIVWKAAAGNTGASTINVSTIGSVALVDEYGVALSGGEVSSTTYNFARYSSTNSNFELLTTKVKQLKNSVNDGGMLVGTGTSVAASASYQFGECPLIESRVTGTVTNGDITQSETTLLGNTGFACLIDDVTTGGGGAVYYRYRMESKDTRKYVSKKAIVFCKVYHDVGSTINYTITVNKADAENDFSSVTNIDTSSSIAVDSAVETLISFVASDMGSCEDGVEIIITVSSGAVTTKDFYLTELSFQLGSEITPFDHVSIGNANDKVKRYFQTFPAVAPFGGYSTAPNAFIALLPLDIEMFDDPAISGPASYSLFINGTGYTVTINTIAKVPSGIRIDFTGTFTANNYAGSVRANTNDMILDARL